MDSVYKSLQTHKAIREKNVASITKAAGNISHNSEIFFFTGRKKKTKTKTEKLETFFRQIIPSQISHPQEDSLATRLKDTIKK